uniref:NADH-ubiquinone oxidoreductase chain 4 n=1 Tax=Pseudophacopteron sp. DMP-2018 TaxID=2908812 RepID=A0A344A2P2_9HEMI|nr:NADH dehydrogenase subunit 4 [Pseudophacopteron sp. DMP-2018]
MLELIFSSFFLIVVKNWMIFSNYICFMMIYLFMNLVLEGEYSLKIIMFSLSLWLVMMMMMSINTNSKSFYLYFLIVWLLVSLQIAFFSYSLFWFYLGFEMSVLPVLLIIFGWGYQPDRLSAGIYMMLYTILFSLPLLVCIFIIKNNLINDFIFLFISLMAFMVKFPMFGLHLWLPRAHVEAPVYGSMILAGIMLKLGGYGLMKISLVLGDLILNYSSFIIVYSCLGGFILSLICFMQSDVKLLVAYSSIVHMSLVLSGLLTMKISGLLGSFYVMIGHGFCSSGLFSLLGVVYSRFLTRSLYINKGMMGVLPVLCLWWFLFCSSNLSFPPSLNLVGELFLFMSLISWSYKMVVFMILLSLFSSLYSIFLFSYSVQGSFLMYFSFKMINVQEYVMLMLHWVPLNLIFLDLSFLSW